LQVFSYKKLTYTYSYSIDSNEVNRLSLWPMGMAIDIVIVIVSLLS